MKCAIGVQDPCEGMVFSRQIREHAVPLCTRHVNRWLNARAPFAWPPKEREKWAKWAAERAQRQEVQEARP